MADSDLQKISLFFFYAFLDEPLAIRASRAASVELNKSEVSSLARVVFVTRKVWDRFRRHLVRGRYRTGASHNWLPGDGIDMTVWQEFQKSAEEDELLMVLWIHILGIPEAEISRGLGLTQGTVRYRAARGLKRIGSLAIGEANGLRL